MSPVASDRTGTGAPDVTIGASAWSLLEEADKCIQCGYCLPVCPTFASMHRESASPRGRINLIRAAAERKIGILCDMKVPIDLCLGCRACEPACPVGVSYGDILAGAKKSILKASTPAAAPDPRFSNDLGEKITGFFLRHIFPFPRRLRLLGNLVWLARASGLLRAAAQSGLPERISPAFGSMAAILPRMDAPWRRPKAGTILPATGKKKARVAFFQGCVMNAVLYRLNRISIELLRAAGCEVCLVREEHCCGALHSHQGFEDEARELAKTNIVAFEASGADFYVNNAGGCGATLKEYEKLFREEPSWRQRAADFAGRTRDISEILVDLGPLPFTREADGFVTYQDSCHLRNVQKVAEPPRKLLRQVADKRFVELPGASSCCASAGIYNLAHFRESMLMLGNKMDAVEESAVTTVVTSNPGCLLQMAAGIRRAGLDKRVRAVHLVEVLFECMEKPGSIDKKLKC